MPAPGCVPPPTEYRPRTERSRFGVRKYALWWSVGSTAKALPHSAPSSRSKSAGSMRCSTSTLASRPSSSNVVSMSRTTASRSRSPSRRQSMPASRRFGTGSRTQSDSPPAGAIASSVRVGAWTYVEYVVGSAGPRVTVRMKSR